SVLSDPESVNVFRAYAFDPIVSTEVSFDIHDGYVDTLFSIETDNDGQTLFALLPQHFSSLSDVSACDSLVGVYQTLYGQQRLCVGSSFLFSQKFQKPLDRFDLSGLSDARRRQLEVFVKEDVQNLSLNAQDTYFLGKELFALANLLDIARQLDLFDEADLIRGRLKSELELWRDNTFSSKDIAKSFYYDSMIGGVVGTPFSFGSELFNDHNFHYGYFIYAASILSRYDEGYLRDNRNFINLLVRDIANFDRNNTDFPYVRGFDFYAGHSWAAGQGLFRDGNNQESSSEAVTAWYAVGLWGNVVDDQRLVDFSNYLYTRESLSALDYWLNIDQQDPRFEGYSHPLVSLVWGGKLDWATWFSPRPEAKLGIQILPISPASLYLGDDLGRVRENFASDMSLQNPTLFKDYLVMYQALYDIDSARLKAQLLLPEDIDGANSRSAIEAWLITVENFLSRQK
ncbi:MAG: hypothetical protein KC736_04845, partial [Candidatus Moranbacteria bacterium]|nr:hypothetical protein [Candidatus Moranbacteria bacterium]